MTHNVLEIVLSIFDDIKEDEGVDQVASALRSLTKILRNYSSTKNPASNINDLISFYTEYKKGIISKEVFYSRVESMKCKMRVIAGKSNNIAVISNIIDIEFGDLIKKMLILGLELSIIILARRK